MMCAHHWPVSWDDIYNNCRERHCILHFVCYVLTGLSVEDEEDSDDDGSGDSDDDDAVGSDGAEDSDSSNVFDGFSHKRSLDKLRYTDPEFYKFLEQNDNKLLEFSVSDSENADEDEEEDQIHKPVQDLEVS
jgi:nucleolar complex protein 2